MKFIKIFGWTALAFAVLSMGGYSRFKVSESQADYKVFLPIIVKGPYEPTKGGIIIHENGTSTIHSNCNDLEVLGAGWYYNNRVWPSTDASGCLAVDRRFVPRLYGDGQVNDPDVLDAAIENAKASGWLLGYGEPNLEWQGNVTPLAGAIAWKKIEDAIEAKGLVVGEDIKLVAPSPNQWGPGHTCDGCAPNEYGHQWVWEMVSHYENLYGKKPHFDAMAWHYYYNYQSSIPAEFQSFFLARRNEALARGLTGDMWILEYSGACWNSGSGYPVRAGDVMDSVTPWLVSTPWITRYAWFANRLDDLTSETLWECSLLNSSGTLYSLGEKYKNY